MPAEHSNQPIVPYQDPTGDIVACFATPAEESQIKPTSTINYWLNKIQAYRNGTHKWGTAETILDLNPQPLISAKTGQPIDDPFRSLVVAARNKHQFWADLVNQIDSGRYKEETTSDQIARAMDRNVHFSFVMGVEYLLGQSGGSKGPPVTLNIKPYRDLAQTYIMAFFRNYPSFGLMHEGLADVITLDIFPALKIREST